MNNILLIWGTMLIIMTGAILVTQDIIWIWVWSITAVIGAIFCWIVSWMSVNGEEF